MLSATGLILSLIVLYLGFRSIQIIELYKEEKVTIPLISLRDNSFKKAMMISAPKHSSKK
jgi:hypothetical protein